MKYTTKIISVDIEHTSLVVEYTPEDPDILPMTLNIRFLEKPILTILDEFGVEVKSPEATFDESLQYSIELAAPVSIWSAQRKMIDNINKLQ